jgi:hypothetical protein
MVSFFELGKNFAHTFTSSTDGNSCCISPFLCNGVHGSAQLIGDRPQDATELLLVLFGHGMEVRLG